MSDELQGWAQGDGAGRVTLSEAAAAVGRVLDDCQAELDAIRRRFRRRPGGPENIDVPERKWIDAETERGRQRAGRPALPPAILIEVSFPASSPVFAHARPVNQCGNVLTTIQVSTCGNAA